MGQPGLLDLLHCSLVPNGPGRWVQQQQAEWGGDHVGMLGRTRVGRGTAAIHLLGLVGLASAKLLARVRWRMLSPWRSSLENIPPPPPPPTPRMQRVGVAFLEEGNNWAVWLFCYLERKETTQFKFIALWFWKKYQSMALGKRIVFVVYFHDLQETTVFLWNTAHRSVGGKVMLHVTSILHNLSQSFSISTCPS